MMIFEYLGVAQAFAQEAVQEAAGQMDQTSGQALWLTYKPLVAACWIHFASVFLLFGTSFFWFYMPREHSLSRPGQMEKALAATTVMLRIAAPVAAMRRLDGARSHEHDERCSLRSPSYWPSCLGTAGCGILLCFTLVLCC